MASATATWIWIVVIIVLLRNAEGRESAHGRLAAKDQFYDGKTEKMEPPASDWREERFSAPVWMFLQGQ